MARRCGVWLVAVAVGLALSSACSEPSRPRNAIIIVLDTLRADRLGCYGNERNTSPSLDALAARGVRFDQAFSPAPWTLPATGALLSGLPPETCFDGDSKLSRSLISELASAGWATAAFTEAAFFSAWFGMDRGFEHFEEAGAMRAVIEGQTVAGGQEGAGIATTFAAAHQWLERAAAAEQPFVLVVHSYEVHMPYRRKRWAKKLPSGRFGETLEMSDLRTLQGGDLVPTAEEIAYVGALYDGGVRFADNHVGELLAAVDALGLNDETVIVVTSDHGEELGQHHPAFLADHGHSLKDDLLNVPLIVADPTRTWPVSQVTWQVRLIDVLPTVMDLLGVAVPDDVQGRSLVPMMAGDEARHRPLMAGGTKAGPPRRALRDGAHKLIVHTDGQAPEGVELTLPVAPVQLYDLRADPGELYNVQADQVELAKNLAQILADWLQKVGGPNGALRAEADDEEIMAQLKALGYVR